MIVFDLKCARAHVFEGWFGSTADYESQRGRGLIACPLCGDIDVGKAVMAPNIAAKRNRAETPLVPVASPAPDAPSPEKMKALLGELARLQAKMLDGSTHVGRDFANQARAMHLGEQETRSIHGQATPAEAKSLIDDGIEVAALPLPVVPPEASN